jgi:Holliday junction resolvase RusA-like endonuclease
MTELKQFFIPGIPKPQSRPKFARMGKFVRTYSPKTDWFGLVYMQGLQNKPSEAYDTPLKLMLQFVLPKPKSAPKGKQWPSVRPDIDNYEKAVLDALTQAGMWTDDGLICEMFTSKVYAKPGEATGCRIAITQLSDNYEDAPLPAKAAASTAPTCTSCDGPLKQCHIGQMIGQPHKYCPKCEPDHLSHCRDGMNVGQ